MIDILIFEHTAEAQFLQNTFVCLEGTELLS